ncbi:hypothetical protein O7599_00595 [Streptomyces sp. WMMC500]|uniref:hypothetical protein n=1 Tax=Streptomyces sp. WMMC500 TaxID=3015154 RepID=UPI00248AF7EB|nr:hypothetical protein [Streptomyces sp. WMMC500]WBB61092.1 hypothetical protein O7599_00595 [Streptomyces sp. WMMC500]
MIRRESYCGGRLVREVEQARDDRAPSGLPAPRADGTALWLLDGERVEPAEAEAFWVVWTSVSRRHPLGETARSWPAITIACAIVLWLVTMVLTQFE